MIYDCFQFFNELDILKLRLHVMDPVVDRFVICEATETFSGMKKPLYYEEHKDMFREFAHKIIHVVIEDTPAGYTHDRDTFQKNAVIRGLKDCTDGDIIIFSDLDEIPNPERIKEVAAAIRANEHDEQHRIFHLAQRLFYCYLNMEEISGKLLACCGDFDDVTKKQWLGTKIFSYEVAKTQPLGELRWHKVRETDIRVADGGWHFGYMGGNGEKDLKKRVAEKVKSAAHQEYNNRAVLAEVEDKIKDGMDIFGRDAVFVQVPIDESFPEYLREHKEEYAHLIKEDESRTTVACRHIRQKIRTCCRSAVAFGRKNIRQILFFAALLIELGIVLVDKSAFSNPWESRLFRVTFLLCMAKIALTKYSLKEWLVMAGFFGLGVISYFSTGRNEIIRIVAFVAAAKGISLPQMMKVTFYTTLTGVLALIMMSLTGILGSTYLEMNYRGNGIERRYCLGLGHPNALHCMVFVLVVLGIYLYWKRLKWYHCFILEGINLGFYVITQSRTGMAVTTFGIFVALCFSLFPRLKETKAVYILGALGVFGCIAFSVAAAIFGCELPVLEKLNKPLTGRIFWSNYFGAASGWSLFSNPQNDQYFDMGYIRLFYWYGIVPAIVYILLKFAQIRYAFKKKDAAALLVITMFALYTVFEAHAVSVYLARNYSLMLLCGGTFSGMLCLKSEKEGYFWQPGKLLKR